MNDVRPHEVSARVVSNHPVTPEVFGITLRVDSGWGPPRPGQFVQIDCPPAGSVPLRRPFSLSGWRRSELGIELDIVYGAVGERTRALSQCRSGEMLSLIGPLGHPFTSFPGRRPVLIGGGRGIAPLLLLAGSLRDDYPDGTILYGARTASHLIPLRDPAYPVHLATEDGTAGFEGSVITLLDRLFQRGEVRGGECALFACGPNRMLAALAVWAEGRDLPCQVSLETLFGCGIGICAGCAVPVRSKDGPGASAFERYALACKDGPVMDAFSIEWEGVHE
jgi:dihydroorotate dehydrogenase electron transfer subunit